jgi:regulator of replication initiation timing
MATVRATPVRDNPHVKELLAILKENNSPSMKDMLAVLGQIGAMEKQLDAAVNELTAMRSQLAEMEASNHPIRNAMQKAVITMQAQVLDLRDKLAELKENFIDGCKNAVAAFKEKGISALDNVAKFFKIKPILESMRNGLDSDIRKDDKAIAQIETMSKEYHEAGRHLKNIGRAFMGKEPIQESKSMGVVAKAFIAPLRVERNGLASMKKSVEAAIGSLAKLEERTERPSIKDTLKNFNEQIAQAKKEAPAPEKSAPANHDL